MEERQIILNQIQTPDGTIIRSMHRHDYVEYTDANGFDYMVDGGDAYLRRSVNEEAPYTELTIYSDSPFEIIRETFYRGGRGLDGKQPLTWVPLNKMSDSWVKACITYNENLGMGDGFANKMYAKELEYRNANGITILD